MSYKELISIYETDVQFPDVSGMEHLDMLMTRSEIAQNASHLSDAERRRVQKADALLLRQAEQFYESIRSVADLSSWRRDESVRATHWWWYLDVITQLPVRSELLSQSMPRDLELSRVGV